jgi:predicted RNA-binding Zn-ribbon protein involved in translation (DUF1610 family)
VSGTSDGSNSSLSNVQWASRVNQKLTRRLYQTDALGIVDEELIDVVGYVLLTRRQSILQATDAHAGRIICPECGTAVLRESKAWDPDAMLDCHQCKWHVPWVDYFKTFQSKHLVGGGAVAFHAEYVERFRRATSPQEKMLAIDRLIHAYHWELVQAPGRSAARELIYASNYQDLLTFLDTLSYGDRSTPGLRAAKRDWDRKLASFYRHRELGFGEDEPND